MAPVSGNAISPGDVPLSHSCPAGALCEPGVLAGSSRSLQGFLHYLRLISAGSRLSLGRHRNLSPEGVGIGQIQITLAQTTLVLASTL